MSYTDTGTSIRRPVAIATDDRLPLRDALLAGVTASLGGGVLFALATGIVAALTGYEALFPFKLVAATISGPVALVDGSGAVAVGLALHLLVSVGFGLLFGALVRQTSSPSSVLLAGLVFGVGALLLMTYVVLPTLNPTLMARVRMVPATWFFLHLLYGAGLSLTPLLGRLFVRAALFTSRRSAAPRVTVERRRRPR